MKQWLMLAVVLLGVCGAAGAQEAQEGTWLRYLGALGTYTIPDDARGPQVSNGTGIHLLYGWQGESGFGWEVGGYGTVFETGSGYGTDFYRWGGGLDLTYALDPVRTFTPFLLVGAGYGRNDEYPNTLDSNDWFANAGIGFVTAPLLTDFMRIRAEVRYIYDSYQDGLGDIRVGAGLEFGLARTPPPPPPAEEQIKVVEVSTGLRDDDEDGIVNDKDNCPNTPPGTRVDGTGCALARITQLHGVTFEFDSDRLRPDARTILGDIAAILKHYPDMTVEIAGHTDSIGSDEYNQKLSEHRAQTVQAYLYSQGIPEAQVQAKGYGKAEPIADNGTEEGRELNRRVEMRILN